MANTNGTSTRTKSKSDYATLFEDAENRALGLDVKRQRAERELDRLLGGHQNAAQIRQLITRPGDGYGVVVGKLAIAERDVKRYQRLMEANADPIEVESIPVAPVENGKSAVPVAS